MQWKGVVRQWEVVVRQWDTVPGGRAVGQVVRQWVVVVRRWKGVVRQCNWIGRAGKEVGLGRMYCGGKGVG